MDFLVYSRRAIGYERILVGDGMLRESSAASGQGIAVTYLSQQSSAVGINIADLNVLPRHTIQRLNTDRGGASHSNPASARLGNGNFLAVWADWRSGVAAVYGQIIDANGNKLGENVPIFAPSQHGNDQRPFAAASPEGGVVVAYRSQIQASDRAISGAWLQRLDSEGRQIIPPVRIDGNSGDFVWDVEVAVLPHAPHHIIGVWQEGVTPRKTFGQIFDAQFNKLVPAKALASHFEQFTVQGDELGRVWLIGQSYESYNVFLYGFDHNLSALLGPIQLNESEGEARTSIRPQIAVLPDVWDGAAESGVHLANGVYFLKLLAGSQQRLRKIVVVR